MALARRCAPRRWPADTQVEIVLVDNRQIEALNRKYLHHSRPTDVIAFTLEERRPKAGIQNPSASAEAPGQRSPGSRRRLPNPEVSPGRASALSQRRKSKIQNEDTIGSLVISAEMARSEASRRGVSARDELALYVVHGLLHLAGYDDATAAQRRRMYKREREVMTGAGRPYVR